MIKRLFLFVIAALIALMLYSMFTAENINSLNGDFQELAFVRNENNTGPIHRAYIYSLNDTLWEQIQLHADLLPHTKYGETKVYYFLKEDVGNEDIPLSLNGLKGSEIKSNCIAQVIKNGQSQIVMKKYPFKE